MTPQEELISRVAKHLHADQHIDAARIVADFTGQPKKAADDSPFEVLNGVLHWSLNNDRFDLGAKMLWGDSLFTPEPHSTKLVWDAFKNSSSVLILGAASLSKSYSAGVYLLLDWLRDPEYTSVCLVGPSEQHLKDNLFTHLVTLHRSSTIPLPGIIGDLFIGLDRKARKSSIRGVVIPLGKTGAGKLQGSKRINRKTPHPVFGPLSRLRVFLDELENIPHGVWKDCDNLFSQLDGVESFKIVGACNPANVNGPVGTRAEPVDGWEKGFDIETSERWKSKRGWDVVRLDAFKCENVIEGRTIYPGLQTKEGLERLIQNAGGVNSPGYYTQGRGCFPPAGTTFSVISATALHDIYGELIFRDRPEKVASVDSALEGTNAAKMAVGRFGLAVGIKHPATHEYPTGKEEIFAVPQWGLQLDQLFSLPAAETVRMANNIKTQCNQLGVKPGWVILDRTGNGSGVHDLLKTIWSPEVRGLNYSEKPSAKKIFDEDTETCAEAFDRAHTELWFALKRWLEFHLIRISPVVDTERLFSQLTGRLYMPGKTQRVESKKDYKSRGNDSPDEADAFTLLLQAARVASGVVPSMAKGGTSSYADAENSEVPYYIDSSNRLEGL